ncbi:MAG: AI-2E family transporter [Magnetococcales bacterium]|nr:AI-2E family transporter [Magnetococcales bacterium]
MTADHTDTLQADSKAVNHSQPKTAQTQAAQPKAAPPDNPSDGEFSPIPQKPNFLVVLLRHFKDPQSITLILVLTAVGLLIGFFGSALAPYFTAIVVAYLLEGMVTPLRKLHFPRLLAILIVFSLFIFVMNLFLFVLLPNLAKQLTKLLGEIPRIADTLKELMHKATDTAAESGFIDPAMVENLLVRMVEGSQDFIGETITYILQGLPGLFSVLIYLVLVPFLVFFFMKDKQLFMAYLRRLLPRERGLLTSVLRDAELGVGGYIRGKFWEMLILGVVSYTVFIYMQFDYAFLLGILTGLSVLIPFLGVAVVTVPVAVLGVVQWGITLEALHPLAAYGILQIIDGNVLAPLILGETVKVHPTTIILAVLFFGSLWGVLGVFFAVPLAVLVKSIFEALSRQPVDDVSDHAS